MSISADAIIDSHIEDNSTTLFSLYEKISLSLNREGRDLSLNKTAETIGTFTAISYSSKLKFDPQNRGEGD